METKIRNATIGKAKAFKNSGIRVYKLQFDQTGPVMVCIGECKKSGAEVVKPKGKCLFPRYK